MGQRGRKTYVEKLTYEQRHRICDRYRSGETLRQLAAAYGVCTGTIVYHLKKAGVPSRPPGFPRREPLKLSWQVWS